MSLPQRITDISSSALRSPKAWLAVGVVLFLLGTGGGVTIGLLYGQSLSSPIPTPTPKQQQIRSGEEVTLGGATLRLSGNWRSDLAATVDTTEAYLGRWAGGSTPTVVRVRRHEGDCEQSPGACEALRKPGGYVLDFRPDTSLLLGAGRGGIVHGLTQLAAQVRKGRGAVSSKRVIDYPDHGTRAFHFVLRNVTVQEARRLVVMARRAQMNTLIIQVADGLRLQSMQAMARNDAWSPDDWKSFIEYARQNGLAVIPEVKFLSHQEKLFAKHRPDLLYNRSTYDPRKPEVYDRGFAIIDDLIRTANPPAIHIGHDEVDGVALHPHTPPGKPLPSGEQPLPPDLFLEDVRRLYGYLRGQGVETWMWGDMVVGPDEFSDMWSPSLHAPPAYAALRDSLPDEIVICDWHYYGKNKNFPTSRAFVDAGHDVLGATWKNKTPIRRFSQYIAQLPKNGRGMIATTWFHVQRDEWSIVEGIATRSGSAFWTAQ